MRADGLQSGLVSMKWIEQYSDVHCVWIKATEQDALHARPEAGGAGRGASGVGRLVLVVRGAGRSGRPSELRARVGFARAHVVPPSEEADVGKAGRPRTGRRRCGLDELITRRGGRGLGELITRRGQGQLCW